MVTYRKATKKDYIGINDFHNRLKNIDRTIDEFRWEFENGPFGPSIYIVAEDNNKIIGTNCVIPIEILLSNGETILTGKSEDTLVDTEYRGQKIFYKIYEVLFKECENHGIHLIWGFTSAYKPFSNLGFEIPYNHMQAVAVHQILPAFRYLSKLNINNGIVDKLKVFGLCMLAKWKNLLCAVNSIPDFDIRFMERDIGELNNLVLNNLQQKHNLFAIHQTLDYQQWRVFDNPYYRENFIFGIYRNDKLVGSIFYNKNKNGVVFLNQVLFNNSVSNKERIKLLSYTNNELFKKGVPWIRSWQFKHNDFALNELRVFDSSGFYIVNRGVGLVWKNLGTSNLNANNFIITRLATQGID